MIDTSPHALVVLPFPTAEAAQQFAQLVIAQIPGSAEPFVLHGSAYVFRSEEEGTTGQIIEVWPESNFEAFVGERGEGHHVLQRLTTEVADAGAEGSPDHDAAGRSAGEGG
jgi:hypothetical protein